MERTNHDQSRRGLSFRKLNTMTEGNNLALGERFSIIVISSNARNYTGGEGAGERKTKRKVKEAGRAHEEKTGLIKNRGPSIGRTRDLPTIRFQKKKLKG